MSEEEKICLENCDQLEVRENGYYCKKHDCQLFIAPPDRDKVHYLCRGNQTKYHVSSADTTGMDFMGQNVFQEKNDS